MTISGAPFPKWVFYFGVGILYGNNKLSRIRVSRILCIAILCLMLSIIETSYIDLYGHKVAGMKPSAMLFSSCIVLILLNPSARQMYLDRLSGSYLTRTLIWIGNVSFYIYLVHCLFMLFIGRVDFISSNWIFYWISTLLVTLVSAYILQKILPSKYHKFLGL